MRQKWSRHLSTKKKECVAVDYTSAWLQLENFSTGSVFWEGQLFLCLMQHWLPGQIQSYSLASETSVCMVGFCIHGNTCFTYRFIPNNEKLNTGCEAMSGFRLEGGGGVRLRLQVATCQTECLMQCT